MSSISEQIKRKLEGNKDYHGQLCQAEPVASQEAEIFSAESIPEDIAEPLTQLLSRLSIQHLYYHQGDALKSLWNGKNVFLCTNEGSGRSTIADIYSILTIVLLHQTALYVIPPGGGIQQRELILKERIEKSGWGWLVNVKSASKATDITSSILRGIDVVITTPEVLKEFLLGMSDYGTDRNNLWFSSLGFVAFEDVESYLPEELSHLKNMVKSLRFQLKMNNPGPRFLFIVSPVGSPQTGAHELLGSDITVIANEHCPKNGFDLLYWMPPLVSRDDKIIRLSYTDEVAEASALFCENEGFYIIWHAFASLSPGELNNLKERILRQLKGSDKAFTIECLSTLKKLQKDKFGKVKGVFILGLPPDFKRIKSLMGNIVATDGFVLIIPPEEPLSHLMVRNSSLWESDDIKLPELIIPDFSTLRRHYIARSIVALPTKGVSKEELINFWGDDVEELLECLFDSKGLSYDESTGIVSVADREMLYATSGDLPWGTLEKDFFTFSINENERLNFSKSLYPWKVFSENVIYRLTDKYIFPSSIKPDELNYRLSAASDRAPVMRFPVVEVQIQTEKPVKEKHRTGKEFGTINVVDLEVEEKFIGYKSFRSYSHPGQITSLTPLPVSRRTLGIKIEDPNLYDFTKLFKIFLPIFYRDLLRMVTITHTENALYLYALYPESSAFIDRLLVNWQDTCPVIFKLAYKILKSCPCPSGCPLCLSIFDQSDNYPEKDAVLMAIADFLDSKKETQSIIKFKKEGLSIEEGVEEKYQEWKKDILNLFKNKLDLKIDNLARMEVLDGTISTDGHDFVGRYSEDKNIVRIKSNLTESKAVCVIAHEYIHNWERTGKKMHESLDNEEIPFDGKLIREGLAEWGAFKILDFFGLKHEMEIIEFEKTVGLGQYSKGFDLLWYIEDKIAGFYGVLDFILNGRVEDPSKPGLVYDLNRLLDESGLRDKIDSEEEKMDHDS